MRKLKFLSISALLGTFVLSLTSCDQKDWTPEIDKIKDDVATLATSVKDLKEQASTMTYIKSITMGEDGKLTITPSTGSAVIYDAKEYVKFDVKFENNTLFVKNPGETEYTSKGQVDPSKFTYGISDAGKLTINGVDTDADLGAWIKANGSTTIVPTVSADGYLVINGVKTTVKINPVITSINGELFVNGVATGVKIDAANAVLINKDADGNTLSVTLTDAKGETATIRVSPSQEPLSSLVFIPQYMDFNKGGHFIPLKTIMSIDGDDVSAFIGVQDVQYRINPTTANTTKTKWTFTTRTVLTRATGDDSTSFLTPTKVSPYGNDALAFNLVAGDGFMDKEWDVIYPENDNKGIILSLQADDKDVFSGKPAVVVSDYAIVIPVEYDAYVSDKTEKKVATAPYYTDYETDVTAAKDFAVLADFSLVYNAKVKTNLYDLVLATAQDTLYDTDRKTFEEHGFQDYKFKFSEVSYKGIDGKTDQSAFINIEANGDITVLQGTAAIDRLPIVKVDIINKLDRVVATAYIKFLITPVANETIEKVIDGGNINYIDLFTGVALSATTGEEWSTNILSNDNMQVSWELMNNIYEELGVSHNDFVAIYGAAAPTIEYNTITSDHTSDFDDNTENADVDSYAMMVAANPYSQFGENKVIVTYSPKGRPALKLTFKYNIVKPVLNRNILLAYQDGKPNSILVKGRQVANAYTMSAALGEAFNYGNAFVAEGAQTAKPAYREPFALDAMTPVDSMIGGAKHQFLFTEVYASPNQVAIDDVTYANTATAAMGEAADMDLDAILGTKTTTPPVSVISLVDKLTTKDRTYNMELKTIYVNTNTDTYKFTVRFVNPLTLVYSAAPKWSFQDSSLPVKLNIVPNYVVKFNGKTMAEAAAGTTALVYKTANTATTVNASEYLTPATAVDNTDVTEGLFFHFTAPQNMSTMSKDSANDNKEGAFTWTNIGSAVINNAFGGNVKATFKTSFAEISVSNDFTITPR